MNNNLDIDEVIIKPEERKSWEINVNSRISDSVKIPIIAINGKNNGPTLCITAGVHPTEYSCIEASLQVSREIDINNLSGKLIILPILNGWQLRRVIAPVVANRTCPIHIFVSLST